MSPAAAGIVVTAMPLAAIAAGRLAPRSVGVGMRTRRGSSSSPAGWPGSRCCPHAGWGWTIPPQLLVGAGLGLALAALTERALAGRARAGRARRLDARGAPRGRRARSAPARAGVDDARSSATRTRRSRAGAAAVLDSRIPPLDKLRLAQDVLGRWSERKASCPTSRRPSRTGPTRASTAPPRRAPGSARPGGHGRLLGPVPARRRARARGARAGGARAGEALEEPL